MVALRMQGCAVRCPQIAAIEQCSSSELTCHLAYCDDLAEENWRELDGGEDNENKLAAVNEVMMSDPNQTHQGSHAICEAIPSLCCQFSARIKTG
jgi:hypothetical protein